MGTNNTSYQITKTVRFKLEPQFDDTKLVKDVQTNENKRNEDNASKLSDFITLITEVIKSFKKCVFFHNIDPKTGEKYKKYDDESKYQKDKTLYVIDKATNLHIWNKLLEVNYTWLRRYMQDEFYSHRAETIGKLPKSYGINQLEYLKKHFELDWLVKIEEVIYNLEEIKIKPQENHSRNSAIAVEITKLKRRSYFEFMKTFVFALSSTNKPDIDNLVRSFRKELDDCEAALNNIYSYFLPLQSKGAELLSGSLNYFTVNKKTTDFDEDEQEANKFLDGNIDLSVYPNFRWETLQLSDKSKDEAYWIVKEWKAKNKSKFLECLKNENYEEAFGIEPFIHTQTYDFESLKRETRNQRICSDILSIKNFSVDNLTKEQRTFITENITTVHLYNDSNEVVIEAVKQKNKEYKNLISEFFKIEDASNQFEIKTYKCIPAYEQLCNDYKQLALKRGQAIAKLSAINKERQTIERLKYWSLIVDCNNEQFLYMIERTEEDKIKKAYNHISGLPTIKNDTEAKYCIHFFESLTLAALRKLCFNKVNNNFIKAVKNNASKNQEDKEVLDVKYEQAMDSDEKKINFYKCVLKYASTLNTQSFKLQSLLDGNFKSLDDFEIALNTICYAKTIKTDVDIDSFLVEQCKSLKFKLTSLDIKNQKVLEKYYENNEPGKYINHKSNSMTKLWKKFWSKKNLDSNFEIRLNPELRIFWRDAKQSRVEKYGADSRKNNRYLRPHYTLALTMCENANSQKINYAFKSTEDKGLEIKAFNGEINRIICQDFALGIDAGSIELATLSVVERKNNLLLPGLFEVCRIVYSQRDYEKEGYLEDGTPKQYKLILNPSYFLNRDLYIKTFFKKNDETPFEDKIDDFEKTKNFLFEKVTVTSIDLTTAKLISGVIVTNGDYKTFENLRMLHAQRIINQVLRKDLTACLDPKRGEKAKDCFIKLKSKVYDGIIYHWRGNHGVVTSFENVEKNLNNIFNEYKAFYTNPNEYLSSHKGKALFDEARLDDNINNTRRSMVANMVGVIKFVYDHFKEKYGHGHICMENFDPITYESHRKEFEGDVLRPLEIALYKKFQNECIVPPIGELLKQRSYTTKDKDGFTQFGIIKFVDKEGTSSTCPKCGKKAYKNDDELAEAKLKKGEFRCPHCSFVVYKTNNNQSDRCTDIFGLLDDNDKIAAFNIGKRAITCEPMEITSDVQKIIDEETKKMLRRESTQTSVSISSQKPVEKTTKSNNMFKNKTSKGGNKKHRR